MLNYYNYLPGSSVSNVNFSKANGFYGSATDGSKEDYRFVVPGGSLSNYKLISSASSVSTNYYYNNSQLYYYIDTRYKIFQDGGFSSSATSYSASFSNLTLTQTIKNFSPYPMSFILLQTRVPSSVSASILIASQISYMNSNYTTTASLNTLYNQIRTGSNPINMGQIGGRTSVTVAKTITLDAFASSTVSWSIYNIPMSPSLNTAFTYGYMIIPITINLSRLHLYHSLQLSNFNTSSVTMTFHSWSRHPNAS